MLLPVGAPRTGRARRRPCTLLAGSHMGGAEQQDRRVASFRDLVEKIPSHPGGQRPEKGLEGQMQFLLIPGPEEVGEVTS